MNKKEKQIKTQSHRQHYGGYQWKKDKEVVKGKVSQICSDEDLTLGSRHTM